MLYYYDPSYILIIIGIIITLFAQMYMQFTFQKYQSIGSKIGITASQVAYKILQENNITNVELGRVSGNLTDHYIPIKKKLNLSDSTANSSSIASIGVAAHEVGHAIQDNRNFFPVTLQIQIVPAVGFISKLSMPLIFIGYLLSIVELFELGIIAFSTTLVYQIITLPVEFDASRRAINSLREMNILDEGELYGVKKVLTAAALTYVAAVASTALQILYYTSKISNRDRRR